MTTQERIERIEAAWAAAALTEDADKVTGDSRTAAVEACELAAFTAAWGLQEHPLDPLIRAERERYDRVRQGPPGRWWRDQTRVDEAAAIWAVVEGLRLVRRGWRPVKTAKAMERKYEGPPHRRDDIALRMYHLIRLAGLTVV